MSRKRLSSGKVRQLKQQEMEKIQAEQNERSERFRIKLHEILKQFNCVIKAQVFVAQGQVTARVMIEYKKSAYRIIKYLFPSVAMQEQRNVDRCNLAISDISKEEDCIIIPGLILTDGSTMTNLQIIASPRSINPLNLPNPSESG